MKKIFTLGALLLAGATAIAWAAEDRALAFPQSYKENFTLYYTGDRMLEDEQTIRLYANDVAVAAAQSGEKLPQGSVLVAELFHAQKDADGEVIESTLGRRLSGGMKAIAVMERRDGWDAQYSDDLKVGDWEFEVFNAAGENLGKNTTGCRECHHPLTDSDHLFSLEHLANAVN